VVDTARVTAHRAAHRAAATVLRAVTGVPLLKAVGDRVVGAEVVEVEGRGPEEVAPGVLPVIPVGRDAESSGGAAAAPALSQRSVVGSSCFTSSKAH
jgi:hypothetical protein